MNQDKNLPVDMIIVEATAIDGEHLPQGTVIKKMNAQLAMDLAGSGKARPATDALIAEYKARAKAQAEADKAKAEADALGSAQNQSVLAELIGAAIAKALATKPATA